MALTVHHSILYTKFSFTVYIYILTVYIQILGLSGLLERFLVSSYKWFYQQKITYTFISRKQLIHNITFFSVENRMYGSLWTSAIKQRKHICKWTILIVVCIIQSAVTWYILLECDSVQYSIYSHIKCFPTRGNSHQAGCC